MTSINITQDCIKCRKCIDVCPAEVFEAKDYVDQSAPQAKPNPDQPNSPIQIIPTHPENCIGCGHCIGVCPVKPASAIVHSDIPQELIIEIDQSKYPTPEQMMEIIKGRRSNRSFTTKTVSEEAIQQIKKAAILAPTATNSKNVKCVIVTDPSTLRQISDFTIKNFSKILTLVDNPIIRPLLKRFAPTIYNYIPAFKKMQSDHANGGDPILRKATALMFIYTPSSSRFGVEDANLAYQNASLMAESLGISQFYTGFVCTAIKQNKQKYINNLLGIKGHIHAGMAFGIAKYQIFRTYTK